MYASFSNQLVHLLHYGLAFTVLLILWPRLMFARIPGDRFEQAVGNYMKMVLLLILLGYALVATKLFEFLAIVAILGLLSARKYLTRKASAARGALQTELATAFYDYLDKKYTMKSVLLAWCRRHLWTVKEVIAHRVSTFGRAMETVIFTIIMAVAIFIRFTDAVLHAAPGMSDGYVTLAWMKYIDSRLLFKDGIYPQGFHIILDLLYKFSGIDALYVLKYTGPLNMTLVVLGYYFVVSRLTGNALAGMVSALTFGLLSVWFTGSAYERQSATNSQEFAFVFVLPTLYFYYLYLQGRRREVFWAAAAGTAVVGLVHTLAFGLLGLGLGAVLAIALLLAWKENLRSVLWMAAAGVGAALLSMLPWPLGTLVGATFHQSSEKYLTSVSVDVPVVSLQPMDYIALVSIFIVLLHAMVRKGDRMARFPQWFTVLLTGGVFLLYYKGGELTHSVLIATRSVDLWALCVPLAIGMAWFAVFQLLAAWAVKRAIERTIVFAGLSASLILVPPQPIIPYKMESDTVVEQYLRITQEFRPKTWMIVSLRNEEYDLAYGSGIHMYGAPAKAGGTDFNLIQVYDPTKLPLTRFGEDKPDTNVPNDVFILVENHLFKVSESNAIYPLMKRNYELWEKQTAELQYWIDRYREAHNPNDGLQSIHVYYEDKDITIYHLKRTQTREEVRKRLWG